MRRAPMVLACALFAGSLAAREAERESITVPVSDPSRPVVLKAALINGGVTVQVHQGKDVVVEGEFRGARGRREPPSEKTAGLRRIGGGGGLRVEEEENRVSITVSPARHADLTIGVPANTSVKLNTVNDGDIVVDGVAGEVDANSINGSVTIRNVSGPVVAHALNKDVTVVFSRVPPGKTMSFSSLNGDIDVTLPADTRARISAKVENGDVYTDFEIHLDGSTQPAVEEQPGAGKGKFRLHGARRVTGTINGGGPELQFTTLNGRVYIRKHP